MPPLTMRAEKDLISIFLKHVRDTPDAIAVMTSDTTWTYQTLFLEVLAFKHYFQTLAIDTPVVICLHRTPRLIAVLLALQWLEVAYIPLEPQMPLARIRAVILDSEASVFFHDTVHHEAYTSLPCEVHALTDLDSTTAVFDVQKERYHVKPNHKKLAYVIYTSGSTGTPKGVCVAKRALNHFLMCMSSYFLNAKYEMLLATTTLTFDIAALELYLPIWQGKTLFLANQAEHKDPIKIKHLLSTYPISLLQGTPSFWNMLHYSGWSGKKDLVALCGGEPLTAQIAENLLPNVSALWNMYGPTEATIWCALKQIKTSTSITVGRPIQGLEMWILDDKMRPLQAGVKGELYISGIGLAESYLNREALTKARFLPYKKAQGQRVYRTGDVACMTDTGEFVIFGRIDNQIKLRGYRIELEDIEAHIESCPGVRACGVSVHQEQLVAYICKAKAGYSEVQLTRQLAAELPEFMIPNRLIYLDDLPLNSSGKLNRKALPAPKLLAAQDKMSALTADEFNMLQIWCEALNISSMSIHDNFFELGGHSLLAARIVAKVQDVFGKVIYLQDIYRAPSITTLLQVLGNAGDVTATEKNNERTSSARWMPLTDFQFVLWISHLFAPAVKTLNVVGRRRIVGDLDLNALNLALQALVRKHEVFSYRTHAFLPIQKRKVRTSVAWSFVSCVDKQGRALEAFLSESMEDLQAYQAWSKYKPPILAKCFSLSHSRIELQIAMPHMISDQQSMEIFFKDLSSAYLYHAHKVRAPVQLESKAFAVYAEEEHAAIRASLKHDEAFWQDYLSDVSLVPFPKHYVVSDMRAKANNYSSFFPISNKQVKAWRDFCIAHAVTLNDMLCAAVGIALHQVCQDEVDMPEQFFVNTVKSTREDPSFDEVIGCFLKTQTIKLDLRGDKNMPHVVKKVQQSVLETAPHQTVSSLIKLAAIGRLNETNQRMKPFLIGLLASFARSMKKRPYYLNPAILNACKRLSKLESPRGFAVNVNIWNSFFGSPKESAQQLFGSRCEPVPLPQKDIFTIDEVLDVCLLNDTAKDSAFLVLSANLKPQFREHLGEVLLDVLD